MSQMDENHRYRPYYRANRRYDDDNCKHQYKKPTKHHHRHHQQQFSSSRRGHRNSNDLSYRRAYRNDYHYPSTNSKSYSYFSSPPRPLMATQIPPPAAPPPPPQPPTVVLHERESWIRSVKKTKTNESTEQKTQYLETMLRMPQQKSLLKSSRFDRMRFADDQLPNNMPPPVNQDDLDQSALHLIEDINNHDEICTLERILFDNDIQRAHSSVNQSKSTVSSGFLIDNCEDEIELPPFSPRTPPPPPPTSSDGVIPLNDEDTNQRRVMLVNELDAADAERRQELKRQKRLHRKLQKKNKSEQPAIAPTISHQEEDEEEEESISDWMIEYDVNQISRLSDEVRQTSLTVTDEDKTEKMNLILTRIKKQQDELKKLKQYVMSILGEQGKPKSNRSNSHRTQDLLLALLNQPTQSGCWLCSGKMYAEVACQCDDEQ